MVEKESFFLREREMGLVGRMERKGREWGLDEFGMMVEKRHGLRRLVAVVDMAGCCW